MKEYEFSYSVRYEDGTIKELKQSECYGRNLRDALDSAEAMVRKVAESDPEIVDWAVWDIGICEGYSVFEGEA